MNKQNITQFDLGDEAKITLAMLFMAAVKNGDREIIGSLLTETGTWIFPGNNLLSGIARGAEAVADKAALVVRYGTNIELTHMLYSIDGLGLSLHNQGKRDGLMLDEFLHSAISYKQGKIDAIDTYLSDIPGMDAFFPGAPTGEFPPNPLSDCNKIRIGKDFAKALQSKDWKLMRSQLSDDVSWTLPGRSLLSGRVDGMDEVIDRAKKLRGFGVQIKVIRFLVGLEGVTLSLHNTASRGDQVLDQQVSILCKFTDGKISSITTYLDDVPGINSFFIDGII